MSNSADKVAEQDQMHTKWFTQFGLAGALVIAVTVSLLLVAVSYFMYLNSPERKYDLARPGSPTNNAVTNIDDAEGDTSKPVDATTAKKKLDSLERELRALGTYNRFDSSDLSDQNIGLQPNEQPVQ